MAVNEYRPRDRSAIRSRGGISLPFPAQSFPFVNTNSLLSGQGNSLTFTRASSADEVGSNGFIQSYATNVARFGYVPVTLAARGLLMEAAATNICLQSEDLTSVTWVKGAATISGNVIAAPDNNTTADKIQEDNTTAAHFVEQVFVKAASAITYTASFFVKQGERTWCFVAADDGVNGNRLWFDVGNGAVGSITSYGTGFTSVTSTITAAPNGFYRITATFTSTAGVALNLYLAMATGNTNVSYAGTAGNGLYVWGAQVVTGIVPVSYIPTTTLAVVKSADVASIALGSWYSTTTSTFFVQFIQPAVTATSQYILATDDGSGGLTNGLEIYANNAVNHFDIYSGGVKTGDLSIAAPSAGTVVKLSISMTANSAVAYQNGVAATINTALTTMPVGSTTLYVGNIAAGSQLNSYEQNVTYYAKVINPAAQQRLTT